MRNYISHCQLYRSLDKLFIEEEADRYNVGMFEVATQEPDKGEEVRRLGKTINVVFLRDQNFGKATHYQFKTEHISEK